MQQLNVTLDSNDLITGNFFNNTQQNENIFNSSNLELSANQQLQPPQLLNITSDYITSMIKYNSTNEELFLNNTGGSFTISSDGTQIPVNGSSSLSEAYAWVNASGGIYLTTLSENNYWANCSQVILQILSNNNLNGTNYTCLDFENIFTANGFGNNYSYIQPSNVTLQGVTNPPYLNYNKTITTPTWNTLVSNSNNIILDNGDANGLVYLNGSTGLLNSTNTSGVVIQNSNFTILNVTGVRSNIIDDQGNNYTVQWYARLNVSSTASLSSGLLANVTDYLGNYYLENYNTSNAQFNGYFININNSNQTVIQNNPYLSSVSLLNTKNNLIQNNIVNGLITVNQSKLFEDPE